MEKFIILNTSADKFYVSADVVYAQLTGTTPNIYITLNYADKQIVLLTQEDLTRITQEI